MLDVWEHMTHDFQAHGETFPESKEALERIKQAISYRTGQEGGAPFTAGLRTEVAAASRKTN